MQVKIELEGYNGGDKRLNPLPETIKLNNIFRVLIGKNEIDYIIFGPCGYEIYCAVEEDSGWRLKEVKRGLTLTKIVEYIEKMVKNKEIYKPKNGVEILKMFLEVDR